MAKEIRESIKNASWIRRMFIAGAELKKQYGSENVFDFSLGNPDLMAPQAFQEALVREASINRPFLHGYMPNAGYMETREPVAQLLSSESGINFTANHVIMTVGAAGAMNIIMKTLLNPRDEVIVFAPYFAEYTFYITNHGGIKVVADTTDELLPDIADLEKKITTKTKIVVINSPNNPTGRVYTQKTYEKLAEILTRKSREFGSQIFILGDEPYKNIIFDDSIYYSPFKFYRNTIVATSFSKDLSLAGERIGYMGISPECEDADEIFQAASFCTRTLGFVNAPALMQRVIPHVLGQTVDISQYKERRDFLFDELTKIGYRIARPEGAFYMFPQSPIADDIKFINILKDNLVLTTPGTGFGKPGYFRISFCVPMKTIEKSIEKFKKAFLEI
ncbi:MAG: pyridoxal phosphate-dependent aminotransferase [Candidatus Marinimicrobia bacterium]|nr:pyridoxal phosphate-dependent aminotransferase [Candidatus Neomarinimicrobiota bacterium]